LEKTCKLLGKGFNLNIFQAQKAVQGIDPGTGNGRRRREIRYNTNEVQNQVSTL
jgi:hypothetical protein